MQINKRKTIIVSSIVLAVVLLSLLALLASNVFNFNKKSKGDATVRGVDVSEYQGTIDWGKLSNEELDFAFIKATEGSTYLDKKFNSNWKNANNTDMAIGAYMFFSLASKGGDQSANFIKHVSLKKGNLPPVVDLELYGKYIKEKPTIESVTSNLNIVLRDLKKKYGVEAMIYTNTSFYESYLAGKYKSNPLWISDYTNIPKLKDGRIWKIWQHSDTGVLEGYKGSEIHIDLNILNGDMSDLEELKIK